MFLSSECQDSQRVLLRLTYVINAMNCLYNLMKRSNVHERLPSSYIELAIHILLQAPYTVESAFETMKSAFGSAFEQPIEEWSRTGVRKLILQSDRLLDIVGAKSLDEVSSTHIKASANLEHVTSHVWLSEIDSCRETMVDLLKALDGSINRQSLQNRFTRHYSLSYHSFLCEDSEKRLETAKRNFANLSSLQTGTVALFWTLPAPTSPSHLELTASRDITPFEVIWTEEAPSTLRPLLTVPLTIRLHPKLVYQ